MTARPRYTWQFLIAGLLGFAVLTGIGVLAVHAAGNAGKLPVTGQSPSSSATAATPDAKLDPDATIAILNGTTTEHLSSAVGTIITDQKWGSVLFWGSASESDVEISAVFYSDPEDAAAAAGLAKELGGLSTYTTTDYADYAADLVVLLGADYRGPGLDEAAAMTAEADAAPDASGTTESDEAVEIDPATGWEIDPVTGFPIDPATGLATDPAAPTS
ncbi:hypothetical protein D3228_04395 [Leucobacter luti]|nr:LytR C-terminal domain-containing protein [Leucobacter luti]MBL3698889.1 hypothetical protein [Leucobacter luti]